VSLVAAGAGGGELFAAVEASSVVVEVVPGSGFGIVKPSAGGVSGGFGDDSLVRSFED
jgi:hypothetical protein